MLEKSALGYAKVILQFTGFHTFHINVSLSTPWKLVAAAVEMNM